MTREAASKALECDTARRLGKCPKCGEFARWTPVEGRIDVFGCTVCPWRYTYGKP